MKLKAEAYICINAFFAFCCDRMWQFATGILLVQLTPSSLRLTASYGLTLSVIAIVLSPFLGDWIDKSQRLKVVQILLAAQKILVIACAITIYICIQYQNASLLLFFQILIVLLGSAANLFSQGLKIAIGKDWIIVVCKNDKDILANTNALVRRIDLIVAIVAPLVIGALMSHISTSVSIVFICVWNIVSLFLEYGSILKVYKMTPALSMKLINKQSVEQNDDQLSLKISNSSSENQERRPLAESEHDSSQASITENPTSSNPSTLCNLVAKRLQSMISGWRIYYRQTVFLAGCALSMLYLTVIGMGGIIIGFSYAMGLSELYVSIFMGLASLFGVFGTFLFPKIRRRIGLAKTGIISFSLQLSMLVICGASIWTPGSPSNLFSGQVYKETSSVGNFTEVDTPPIFMNDSIYLNTTNQTRAANTPKENSTISTLNKDNKNPTTPIKPTRILTSVIVLLSGIVLSRTGLWLSDLTIIQLQQEHVPESERGIVSGVQNSTNHSFEILMFLLTIAFPNVEQFGILILISISAIISAGMVYLIFVSRFQQTFLNSKERITENSERQDLSVIT
ncbi:ferroportin-like [Clytia hemisphaerica]|uniref:Solute carrier family 40 member n=1 Tax=Clytia hemisphaerica TaxID=252671 RepID=A0A7M5UT59_9CNID|eukprot:TCONS_00009518-protein